MDAVSLDRVREEFARWRKKRVGRERIPDFLWSLCLRCAVEDKLSVVAKAANVDYYQLKARVEKSNSGKALTVSALNPPGLTYSAETKICLSHPTGWKIEIDPNDPVSIRFLQSFFNAGEQYASGLTTDADFSGPQSGGLSEGNRITRRVYLGATAD
jgi:hypothetical protein